MQDDFVHKQSVFIKKLFLFNQHSPLSEKNYFIDHMLLIKIHSKLTRALEQYNLHLHLKHFVAALDSKRPL